MAVLEQWLLLALFNVLAQPATPANVTLPECDTSTIAPLTSPEHTCVKDNLTIGINQYNRIASYTFTCEGTNITFPAPPEYRLEHLKLYLNVFSCSPGDVVSFLNSIYGTLTIYQASIYATSNILTSADMDNLKNIDLLYIKLDADTILPINATCSWSTVRYLQILGGKLNSHQQTEDVPVNMTRLPANSFCGLKSLLQFHIQDNNNIETIEADAFRGLNELQKLSLTNSILKYIDAGAFSGTPMLTSLDLSYNVLEKLPHGLLQSLENLVEVILRGNQLKIIDSEAFAQLPSLKLIDISNCTITALSASVFSESDNLKTLYIHQNNLESLPTKIFRDQRQLERLYLGYNRLQDPRKFNIFNNLKYLKHLDLSNNKIRTLPKSLFLELNNLEEMDLSNNNISTITDELVHDPKYYIVTLNDMIEKQFEANPFKHFAKLKRLNLAANQIGTLFYMRKDLQSLLNLEYLNFSRNWLGYDEFDIALKNFTNSNITVDLSYNYMNYIDLKADGMLNYNPSGANSTVILTGNPIKCDCKSYGLYLRLIGFNQPGEPNYLLDSNCTHPPHLSGQRLQDISPEFLVCDYTVKLCPENCVNCVITENEMNINCQKLPPEEFIDSLYYYSEIGSVTVNLKEQPPCLEDRDISKLNLSNAGIQSLKLIPNKYLNTLDVSHNNLSTLPDEFSKGNYTLYLSNNPFQCECEFLKDIFALYKRGLVPDYNETTCLNGKKVVQIDINELCTGPIRLISLIGCSTIGSFVALVAVIKLYLNAHEIWMSFLKLFFRHKYEKTRIEMRKIGIEAAKKYDLFISYAHQDENFVAETLLPILENEFNQKVCVHTRDWIVGNVIANQIIESVENSRRTVIILSEHFLMSEWSEVEFHTAHNWSIQEGKPRIIIILLKEEVARDERMGAELKSYIASNTYLLWGDPLFWEKLQKVLPDKIPKYIW